MQPKHTDAQPTTLPPASGEDEQQVAQLVGALYAEMPASEQSRLLARMLKPLGLLSLAAVANGTFARLWYRGEHDSGHIRLEDAHDLPSSDIVTLVEFVQQVSAETIEGVAGSLCSSPALAGSAAAAMLVRVLLRRLQARRATAPAGAH